METTDTWQDLQCWLGFHNWIIAIETRELGHHYIVQYDEKLAKWLGLKWSYIGSNIIVSVEDRYYRDGVCSHCDKTDVSYSKMLWDLKAKIAADQAVQAARDAKINQLRQSLEETRAHVGPKLT